MYLFKLTNPATSDVWHIPFRTIQISDELNAGVNGSLTIDYLSLKRYAEQFNLSPDDIVSSSYREWALYKDSSLLFGGVLLHRKISGSGTQPTTLNLTICDFFNALERRITGNAGASWKFTNQDSSDIAWALVNQTQALTNGDMGITRGLDPTTVNRDRTFRFDNIRDEIVKMSNREQDNGFDFEVTAEKVFNLYYPSKGSVRTDMRLDDFNIISWTSDRPLSHKLANEITVLGAGLDDDITTVIVQDTLVQANWKLEQEILAEKNTQTTTNLTDKGTKVLNAKKYPAETVSVKVSADSPDIADYNVGDSLPVIIKELNFNRTLRIAKRSIQIEQNGYATVDLAFDYV